MLGPGGARAGEQVHRTRFGRRVVVLFAVDARGGAVLVLRADGHSVAVAADGDADAEPILLARVRGLQKDLLGPGGSVPDKDIRGARRRVRRLIVFTSCRIDARRHAVFIGRAGSDRVAVFAERERVAKGVLHLGVLGLDARLTGPDQIGSAPL